MEMKNATPSSVNRMAKPRRAIDVAPLLSIAVC
jgi:hypothetical protein